MNTLYPRPGIMEIRPYKPGKSALTGITDVIKLSSNEGALGPSPMAVEAFRGQGDELHRYPDGEATSLREAIGRRYNLDPSRIICGAGSDELFYNLARAYAGPGDEILYSQHGFNIYPIVAHSVGATPVTAPERNLIFDVDAILDSVNSRTRIVFIANPNNPTGSYISGDELRRLRQGLSEGILLVVDGAYAEYVNRSDYEDGVTLVDGSENTVMTRTFSKIYGLGALRVGWGYCPTKIIDVLNRLRAPFNITAPSQAAAIAAINDTEHVLLSQEHNRHWLSWLTDQVQAHSNSGLKVYPSVGNFILVQFPDFPGRRASDANSFLARRGIIPRETTGYGLPDCLRITIGKEGEVKYLATAISDFVFSWGKSVK
jgi:histidinol-phosphate aminotransferase